MPDANKDPQNNAGEGTTPQGEGENNSQQNQHKQGDTVPHAKFHEERERRKAVEAKLAEREAADKAENDRRLAEQGEFKTLLEQKEQELKSVKESLESKTALLNDFVSTAEAQIAEMLKKVPEKDLPLINSIIDGKNIVQKQSLIPSLLERFSVTGTPVNNGVKTPGQPVKADRANEVRAKIDEIRAKGGSPMDLILLQQELDFLEGK